MINELEDIQNFPTYKRSHLTPHMMHDMRQLSRRLNRIFNNFWDPFDVDVMSGADESLSIPLLACDLDDTTDHYLLKVDVPGIPKDKLNVEVSGNILTVTGERKTINRSAGEKIDRKIYRSFTLPKDAITDRIEARCVNGVLEVAIAKSEIAKPKKIPIVESSYTFNKIAGKAKDALGASKTEIKKEGKAA